LLNLFSVFKIIIAGDHISNVIIHKEAKYQMLIEDKLIADANHAHSAQNHHTRAEITE